MPMCQGPVGRCTLLPRWDGPAKRVLRSSSVVGKKSERFSGVDACGSGATSTQLFMHDMMATPADVLSTLTCMLPGLLHFLRLLRQPRQQQLSSKGGKIIISSQSTDSVLPLLAPAGLQAVHQRRHDCCHSPVQRHGRWPQSGAPHVAHACPISC